MYCSDQICCLFDDTHYLLANIGLQRELFIIMTCPAGAKHTNKEVHVARCCTEVNMEAAEISISFSFIEK